MLYAKVIPDLSLSRTDKMFDYEVPFEMISTLDIGMRVKVTFGAGNRYMEGYVVDICDKTDFDSDKIKLIAKITDKESFLSKELIELAWWMKKRYITTFSSCLNTIFPSGADIKNTVKFVFISDAEKANKYIEENSSKVKFRSAINVLKYILENGETEQSKLLKELNISLSPLKTLEKNGIICFKNGRRNYKPKYDFSPYNKHILNPKQQKIYESLCTEKSEKPNLIFGITGSGKTEIYLQYIDYVISCGKKAIVLVPEISLTPLMVERFKGRFGDRVAFTHSRMSQGERLDVWLKAKYGEVDIVIGPRSAVFMPFENLGTIIIDEEHDDSYKSEQNPKYDAIEVAVERCRQNNAKAVLGSATPSVKSYYMAEKGQYNIFTLDERAGEGSLPKCEIIDMRKEIEKGNFSVVSDRLYEEISKALSEKKQIMLFINRRGASTFVSCRKCGHVMMCKRCNVSYKYHSKGNFLMCHYCGAKESVPKVCPECGSKYIKYFGAGTQKIEDEIKKLFPSARVLRMDYDTTRGKYGHAQILEAFKKRQADILIGTQMIAKGHDFHNVSLVGIMAADISLNSMDYKGAERTFELITQAAGRAGRGDGNGRVIIQTYDSENFAIKAAANHDYVSFYNQERDLRSIMGYPPFSYVFTVLSVGKNEQKPLEALNVFNDIVSKLDNGNITILGPSEAIISKIKDQFRFRLILKCNDDEYMRSICQKASDAFANLKGYSDVYINIYMNSETII